VTMPSEIAYSYLPVSPQNSSPQTLASNPIIDQLILMWQILMHPPFLTATVVILAFFIIIGLLTRRKRRVQG
jgi:hypothetical protein